MNERPTTHAIRLRRLALALALALAWYAMNPAPGPARGVRRDEKRPDEKRREAKSPRRVGFRSVLARGEKTRAVAVPTKPEGQDVNDMEWPDVIDLR